MMRNTGKCLHTPLAKPLMSGIRDLCRVFCRGLSSSSIILGRMVTQPITPSSTPLAITMPRSRPRVKLMKHRAMKPAMVVMELPSTEAKVSWMATAMASLWSVVRSSCSL